MSSSLSFATAVTFVWLGMVLAISFLETPLKFRAPEVTVQIGLGIGRLVFRALNVAELVFAMLLLIAVAIGNPPGRVVLSEMAAIVVLMVQVAVIRPLLTRRSDRVLAGEDVPRSAGHYWYVALEVTKVVSLLTSGILLLAL
jgi:hypothetical protein